MPGTSSVNGVISGMNTDDIISKLIELERAPITRMQSKKDKLNARLTAWQDANTRILALKSKMDSLANSLTFDARKFTSSDEAILKGTVAPGAQTGTFYLKVNALARAHQLRTDGDGYADIDSTHIGTGTISIGTGSSGAKVITLDDSNNTLAGLRDAINRSGAGVKASIVSDGSTGTPYHLIITSATSGSAGAITISSTGAAPTFGTVVQAAQDASVTMGEGAGAITVTKSTNQVSDLLQGVTLDLRTSDVGQTVTVTIGEDPASVKQAIKDFVDQYNNLIDFMGRQFKYDTTTKATGALFADSDLRGIQTDISNKLFSKMDGLDQSITLLSQIGVTSGVNNKLSIDDVAFDKALSENLTGVKGLFASVGETSDANISFVSSTSATKASTTGYAVQITAVAARARVTAGVAQTDALLADEELTINGTTIRLTAGMTQTQVISAINEQSSKTGLAASATDTNGQGTGNYLTLTRVGYGSALTISAVSNTSSGGGSGTSGIGTTTVTQASFGGEAGTGTGVAGADVAGTINGEAATGVGQMLSGNSGNENTDGLRIRVGAQSPGSYGSVKLTRGLACGLGDYLDFITRAGTGTVNNAQKSLQTMMKDIDTSVTDMEARVAAKRERLVMQFAAMEAALGKMQNLSSQLGGQLSQASNGWLTG